MLEGVLYVAGASLLFGAIPSINKYVLTGGMTAMGLTLFTQIISCIGAFLITRLKKESVYIQWRQVLQLLLFGAIGMGTTSCLVNNAVMLIPVGLATVLHFLYPTIVAILMMLLFKQKLSIYKALAIVCSISGMLLISNLKSGVEVKLEGIALALLSSLTYASYIIYNDKGKTNTLPLFTKIFYFSMGSSVLFGLICLANGSIGRPVSSTGLIMLLISGVGGLVAHYFITAGIRKIGASTASFVNMLEPVASIVISAIAYSELPKGVMMAGMVLILTAVFIMAMDGYKTSEKETN